jgi:quercetin dioxygenase-like cupin family protein
MSNEMRLPGALTLVRHDAVAAARAGTDRMRGDAWVAPLLRSEREGEPTAFRVTHAPGARSAWHSHPLGQLLIVEQGVCRVQCEGGPIERASAGELVWIPPGVLHWHGADDGVAMVYLSVQQVLAGRVADWPEDAH